jgi:uncharacterized protein YjiS (DUF1127 family)
MRETTTSYQLSPRLTVAPDRGQTTLSRVRALFQLWRRRAHERHEAVKFTHRDFCDVGVSRAEVEYELSKPFWRPAVEDGDRACAAPSSARVNGFRTTR